MVMSGVLGRRHEESGSSADLGMAIGEETVSVIGCPVCNRPIDRGTSRCPGCATRLVGGVPLRLAGLFIALGTTIGMLVGGTIVGTVARPTVVIDPTAQAPAVAPSVAPGNQAPAAPAVSPAQAVAVGALRHSNVLNERLAAAATMLAETAGAQPTDSIRIAGTLRLIAADAAAGSDMASRAARWSGASGLAAELEGFYDQVRATARRGLGASITSRESYRIAAHEMLDVLAVLPELGVRTQGLIDQAS